MLEIDRDRIDELHRQALATMLEQEDESLEHRYLFAEAVADEVRKKYEGQLKLLNVDVNKLVFGCDKLIQEKNKYKQQAEAMRNALNTVKVTCKVLASLDNFSHPETVKGIGQIAHDAQIQEAQNVWL